MHLYVPATDAVWYGFLFHLLRPGNYAFSPCFSCMCSEHFLRFERVVVNHAFLGELCVSKQNPFAFNRAYVVETFEGKNFVVLWLFVKVFFIKFRGVASSGKQSAKIFTINVFFTNLQKLSPSHYMIYTVIIKCRRIVAIVIATGYPFPTGQALSTDRHHPGTASH